MTKKPSRPYIGVDYKTLFYTVLLIALVFMSYAFIQGLFSAKIQETDHTTTTIQEPRESEIMVCKPCPESSEWNECINGQQSRKTYHCSPSTNYQCESKTEYRSCPSFPTDEYIERSYSWEYGGDVWTWSASFPKVLYDYYREKPRPITRDYAVYATDPYDDKMIDSLVDVFNKSSERNDYSKYETVGLIVAFVQSLPYTTDNVTTPYDEYPRYPLETLVDNGGDCEDTSILTAVLLQRLGYGVVLLEFPNHMAVGVSCEEGVGAYFEDDYGNKFCYLETTGSGWEIGEIPFQYQDSRAILRYLIAKPILNIEWNSKAIDSDIFKVVYEMTINATNEGSADAKNTTLWVGFDSTTEGKVWNQNTGKSYDIRPSESLNSIVTLSIPRNVYTRLHIVVYGDNFLPQERVSEWIKV
jgi:hypothetical protein